MITLKKKPTPHTENSVVKYERPQNKHLRPFPKGVSGNPGGRPKILGDSLKKQLEAEAEDGRSVAEHVTENLIANAQSPWPHSVQAFRTIRELVEPTEAEEAETTATALHSAFLHGFLRIAQAKSASVIEV